MSDSSATPGPAPSTRAAKLAQQVEKQDRQNGGAIGAVVEQIEIDNERLEQAIAKKERLLQQLHRLNADILLHQGGSWAMPSGPPATRTGAT